MDELSQTLLWQRIPIHSQCFQQDWLVGRNYSFLGCWRSQRLHDDVELACGGASPTSTLIQLDWRESVREVGQSCSRHSHLDNANLHVLWLSLFYLAADRKCRLPLLGRRI